jgi:hypothetical protein
MAERVSFLKEVKEKGVMVLNGGFERVSDGAELLKPFFWVVTGHGSKDFAELFKRDAACFYTCSIPVIEELTRRGFEVKEVSIGVDVPDGIFFDERKGQVFPLEKFQPQRVFRIVVNGRVGGVYFSKDRFLVATDWTHNDACIQVLREIMPMLSKIFRKRGRNLPRFVPRIAFGADPEFELIDSRSRRVVSASGIIAGGTDSRCKIGKDGAGNQVEIRPEPSSDIEKFIIEFKSVLKQFATMYPGYSLSAQGDRFALGGHIHVSVPSSKGVLRLLDNWIGRYVIDLSGSARGSYKKLGAYETKPWGFEYRTPPAAVFLNQSILRAVLHIVKRVLKAYYSPEGVTLYPTDEEVRRLGLERYWAMLNKFISDYYGLDKDVLKQWRVSAKAEPRVDLVFGDDWKREVKGYVKELFFKKVGKGLVKKLNDRGVYRVVFFGLKKERGEVCNFSSSMFERIDFSYSVDNGIAFGFPWAVRMPEGLTDGLKEKWSILIDEVIDDLSRRVK